MSGFDITMYRDMFVEEAEELFESADNVLLEAENNGSLPRIISIIFIRQEGNQSTPCEMWEHGERLPVGGNCWYTRETCRCVQIHSSSLPQ